MKINFFKPSEIEKPIRLSVHKSGKLGFSKEAEAKLKLEEHRFIAVGRNEEEENDQNLYLAIVSLPDEGFKVTKAGEYYSLNLKLLFDKLGLAYQEGQLSFDMTTLKVEGETFYKLKMVDKNNKNEDEKDED